MYGHSHNNTDMYNFSPEFLGSMMTQLPPPHAAAPDNYFPPPPRLAIPAYELDSVSSGRFDSPSYGTIQRSGSSHSIATTHQIHSSNGFFNQTLSSSPTDQLLDSEGSSSTTMGRVFSMEDLQGTNIVQSHYHNRSESPLSSESNSIIESMNVKACRYSPDEKKERIERYRTKKTQRNFTKKIKYVCRKTLADSRPRIRGRFARNEEIEKAMMENDHQCTSHETGGGSEEVFYEEDDVNWMNNIFDSCPPNFIP